MPTVTVRKDQLREFEVKLPRTGCKLTGRRRRVGTRRVLGVKTEVVDVEIELPPPGWQGSMTNTIYSLPGVILYGAMIFPKGTLWRLKELYYWHLSRSGS